MLQNSVEVYDPLEHTWTNVASLSQARARFALVSAGAYLYAIGGQVTTDGGVANTTTSVERYDPSSPTHTWVNVASLPQPRGALAGGALNGGSTIIAAAGGTNALTGSGGSTTPYLYDVASNTWSEGAPMLFQIGLAGGAVVGNGFYVWGHDGLCVQPGQIFIPATGGQPEDGWSILAGMPTKRSSFGIAAVGDVVYAIGGQPSGNTEIAILESYSATPASHLQIQEPPVQPCGGDGGGGFPTFSGGGQSAQVNEFLAYDGISASRTTVSGGEVRFTIFYGPTIITASFHATLDGTDVMAELNAAPGASETVEIGDLSAGRHVLILSVDGQTSKGRTATERDRLTFIVP